MMAAVGSPVMAVLVNGFIVLLVAIGPALFVQSWFEAGQVVSTLVGLSVSVALLAPAWLLAFWTWRRGWLRRPVPLDASIPFPRGYLERVGAKSKGLRAAKQAGLTVAQGWMLSDATERGAAALSRDLYALAQEHGIERWVVRSSFPEEDREFLFPGVFASEVGVDATDTAAVQAAIERVQASRRQARADHHREALGLTSSDTETGCVLVQEHIDSPLLGVACSFHPSHRRLDESKVEMYGDGGACLGEESYSHILGRWQTTTELLDDTQRAEVLEALGVGETLLAGPVVMEFGIAHGHVVVFQFRAAPPVALLDSWTAVGPVGVNPEPLPELYTDILYGEDLERLRSALQRGLLTVTASGAPPTQARVRLWNNRPVVAYAPVAHSLRFHPRRFGLWSLLFLFLRSEGKTRRAVAQARRQARSKPDIVAVRLLADVQAEAHLAAERYRSLAATLRELRSRASQFHPPIDWVGWSTGRALRKAARLDALREGLHREIMRKLEALAKCAAPGSSRLGAHLRLSEWENWPKGGDCPVEAAELTRRQSAFAAREGGRLPTVLLSDSKRPDVLAPAPPTATSAGAREPLRGLSVLVPGEAAGRVVRAGSRADGAIVVIPDQSTRWLDSVRGAAGVLLVGGGVLSHTALSLMELSVPTLCGLSDGEAESLHGATLRFEGNDLVIEEPPPA